MSQEGRIQLRKSGTWSVYPCTTRWEGVLVHGLAICSLFTGKCGGTARPTLRHLKLFHKKWKIPNYRLGRWTSFELTEPLNVGSTEVLYCFLENLTFPFVVTCAILVLLDYRKRREELRSSKKQQWTAMHSKFSV